jgi:hypothetical protein
MDREALVVFLKKIGLFSGFSLVIYVGFLIFWGELVPVHFHKNLIYNMGQNGHFYSRLKEAKTTKNIDVLFLGSSHAYRGFDGRIFKEAGFSSFNLGSSSQTPVQTEVLVKRYLDKMNPKIVVFEVFQPILDMDGIESSIDLVNSEKISSDMLPLLLTEMNPKVFNSFVFSGYKQVFGFYDAFVEKPILGKDTYIKGGFVETAAPFSNTTTLPVISKQKVQKQWESLDAILALLIKRNIKFILVQAPIQKELYKSVHTIKFDEEMSKRGMYYNFNELITMDDSLDFKDEHHLNQRGVEKFNRALLGYLGFK